MRSSLKVAAHRRNEQIAGTVAMAGCAVLWSTSGLFIKLIDWQPFAIAGGRSLIAMVFLWVVIRRPRFTFSLDQLAAALAYAATMILFVIANKHTTAANAILLQYGAPIYVAILGSILLKERPKPEHWLALAAMAFGMFLFFRESLGGGEFIGDLLATVTGITFAVNIVFMRKQRESRPLDALLLGHIFTAFFAVGISLFLPAPVLSVKSLAAVGALGVLQIGVAAILFSYGIQRITALESILTAVIEPILNPFWVFVVVGETPNGNALAGGAIIIGAVMVSSFISVRRQNRALPTVGPSS